MKCIQCQGQTRRATAPFHINRKVCHLMLDSVPAWVCEQCGEAYFEEKEVDIVQDLVRSIEAKAGALALT
jgi:YgiT-type zinc finger domain-containing protein